jgi:hypothetical protein
MISIASGRFGCLFMYFVALSAFSQVGALIPIAFQQFFAKGQLKNK